MALTFNSPTLAGNAAEAENDTVQSFDIASDRDAVVAKLAGSDEIEALTSTINVYDMNSIVTFGSKAAEDISKASDTLLRGMSTSRVDDSNALMGTLAKIMAEFDPDELEGNPTLLGKLFGGARKQLDKVLAKYQTMGDEVDKIYVALRKYENEIRQSNQKLETLFQANVGYFHELEKYIIAGEQGCSEIDAYIEEYREKQERTGDKSIEFEIQTLTNARTMLEQRTHDLKLAEAVAMQSIPMIKIMQFNNMNLARKINSAFIVTLPVFKQALAQAILLKRQRIQADAMNALDRRTNEMIARNARSATEQAKLTARLASGSSVQAGTLQDSWQAIMSGIDEARRLQDSSRAQRQQDQARLENIKQNYQRRLSAAH